MIWCRFSGVVGSMKGWFLIPHSHLGWVEMHFIPIYPIFNSLLAILILITSSRKLRSQALAQKRHCRDRLLASITSISTISPLSHNVNTNTVFQVLHLFTCPRCLSSYKIMSSLTAQEPSGSNLRNLVNKSLFLLQVWETILSYFFMLLGRTARGCIED